MPARPARRLYVSNLPEDATEQSITAMFTKHGMVREVVMNLQAKRATAPGHPPSTIACIVR